MNVLFVLDKVFEVIIPFEILRRKDKMTSFKIHYSVSSRFLNEATQGKEDAAKIPSPHGAALVVELDIIPRLHGDFKRALHLLETGDFRRIGALRNHRVRKLQRLRHMFGGKLFVFP